MANQTRAETSRAASARPAIGGQINRGRLEIDVSALPDDVEPTWIREIERGEYQHDNVASAMERGYVPVEASQLPQYKSRALPGAPVGTQTDDTLIRRGGMVLMARPRHLADEERRYHAEVTAQRARSVAKQNDPAAPKDGTNFAEAPPEIVEKTSHGARGRFSA